MTTNTLSDGSASVTAETETLTCIHRGTEAGTCTQGGKVWHCNHPAVLWTVTERCAVCTHRNKPIAPALLSPTAPAPVPPPLSPTAPAPVPPPPHVTGPRDRHRRRQRFVNQQLGPDQPEGVLFTRDMKPAGLANLWYGAELFLCLPGPSLTTLPLDQLNRRGIVTMSVNNGACVVRPTLWTHVDPPEKFHEAIWNDPGIIKLIPTRCFGKMTRRQKPDGTFEMADPAYSFPAVYGYHRDGTFDQDTYLTKPSVCWGNCKKASLVNHRPHVLNVMFTVFKLAYLLGFRTVYLLGCDFRMEHGEPIYAFDEQKHAGAVDSNNGTYLKLALMLGQLAPKLHEAGMSVYNCTQKSGLLAFPHMNFSEAMTNATRRIPSAIRTAGWYCKSNDRESGD